MWKDILSVHGTVNIHFLTFLENPQETEPHFLYPNMQSVTSPFISVHVLKNLYSDLIGPIKKNNHNIFCLFKKTNQTNPLPQTLSPLFPFLILEL